MITISSTAKKEPVPTLIKVQQVAKLLNISRHTVHQLIASGDLEAANVNPSRKKRQHWRITRKSLLKFYAKRFGHNLNHALENPFEVKE